MRCWYLIYTKPTEEFRAMVNLERQNFTTYLPVLMSPASCSCQGRQHNPLFPRYLFVEINHDTDDMSKITSTSGVSNLVKFGNQLATVDPAVIDQVRQSEAKLNSKLAPEIQPQAKLKAKTRPNEFTSKNKEKRVLELLASLSHARNGSQHPSISARAATI